MKLRGIAIGVTLAALLSVLIAWLWGTPPLARVSFAEGSVERDRRGAEQQWQPAQVGNALGLGDGLRTARESRARLSLSHGTVLQVDADTTLRLLSSSPGHESIRIERGSALIEAGEAELTIETSAGSVRVGRNGRVAVRESKNDTWVRVDMGRAELGWTKTGPLLAGQERSTPHAEGQPSAPTPAEQRAAAGAVPRAPRGVSALVRGGDVRVQHEGEQTASPIAAGAHHLPVGTRVTVAADSSLELEQGQGGNLITTGRAELVVGDGEHVATRVLSGKLRASAGRVPVELEVPGGRIVMMVDETGVAAATLRVSKQDTQVDVEGGSVGLVGKGTEQTLHAGASGHLRPGDGAARSDAPEPSSAIASAHPRPGDGAARTATPEPSSARPSSDQPSGPELFDLSLPLGASTQVHDPKPPTAIVFSLADKCAGRPATLEQASRGPTYKPSATGDRQLIAWFPAGSTAYRVRCQLEHGSKVVASGRVTVQRDQAERQVTKRAPEVELDLDGRKYTAVYQTLLPRVQVRLPGAASGKLVLRITSGAATRDYAAGQGQITLESGQLKEGEHRLQLEGPGVRAKPTTLTIRFDNAAPAAYVESAQGLARNADRTFTLRGGVLPGSEVSVNGARIPLDKESRFDARVPLAPGARGFGLWIKHPRAGSHYYVRRAPDGAVP